MKSTIRLWCLNMRVQWVYYLIPLLLTYGLLLPYQYQMLAFANEEIIFRVKEIARNYLLLFTIWFQYISLRMILSVYLREVSCIKLKDKCIWCIYNILITTLCFFPYFTILVWILGTNTDGISNIVLECIGVAIFSHCTMYLLRSASGGLALLIGVLFIYINYLI